ncbi:MAG: hypothetical protein RI919_972, partial [Actinomycetota bacterium]
SLDWAMESKASAKHSCLKISMPALQKTRRDEEAPFQPAN